MILQTGVKALIKQDEKYLFLRRSKDFKQGPQKWDIPGGRININETLDVALAREVEEETGLRLTSIDSLLAAQDIFVHDKGLHVVRLTYIATAQGTISISDEHDNHRWMSLEDALAEPNVDTYVREVMRSM